MGLSSNQDLVLMTKDVEVLSFNLSTNVLRFFYNNKAMEIEINLDMLKKLFNIS